MTDNPNWHEDTFDGDAQVLTEDNTKIKRPNMFKVILLNDDYTPMEFVTWLLQKVFHKSAEESVHLMLAVHQKGQAICGVYPYDVARTKTMQVRTLAEKHEHPLECTLEEDGGDHE